MSLLEAQVSEVRALLEGAPSVPLDFATAETYPATQSAGLILKNSVVAELGEPQVRPSARAILYTSETRPDSVRLIGEPLEAIRGQSVSYAQIVILSGEKIDAELYYQATLRMQRQFDVPGFMVKFNGPKVWVRCADVDGKMTDLKTVGASYIRRIHEAFPAVSGVEVWFVVNRDGLTQTLCGIAEGMSNTAKELKEGVWKARGFDYRSCQLSEHCGSCSDKKTCASVRSIEQKVRIRRRKEEKEKSE